MINYRTIITYNSTTAQWEAYTVKTVIMDKLSNASIRGCIHMIMSDIHADMNGSEDYKLELSVE